MTNKFTFTFALALALGFSVFAQDKPSDAAPAKPKAKKAKAAKAAARPATAQTPLSFSPIGTATVKQENVNVRGKASFNGEVIAKLRKGDTVTLLEEITVKQPKKDEPAKWFRIALPPKTPVWAFAEFINLDAKTVVPKKLNLRSGPGENYSVIGYLKKGDAVKVASTKEDWIQLEAPENCFAFVAARFLEKQAPAPAPVLVASPTPVPAPEVTTLPPSETPKPAEAAPVEAPAPTPAPAPEVPAPAAASESQDPVRRIVKREGIVRYTASIQAPTSFQLESTDTRRLINYLYSPVNEVDQTPIFDIRPFLNQKTVVTGEEFMDKRWKSVPVLQIETLELAEP